MNNLKLFISLLSLALYTGLQAQSSITWTDIVGASVSGDTIKMTAANGWGNAGAVSSLELLGGSDGWMECTILETNTTRAIGLSPLNLDDKETSIGYGFHFRYNGTFNIIFSGSNLSSWQSYSSGDVFRIEKVNDSIYYYRNGSEVTRKPVASTIPLIVDAAFNSTGSTLFNVKHSNSFQTPVTTSYESIDWENVIGLDMSGNPIEMTAENGWGNAGAASKKVLPKGKSGWAEVTTIETRKTKAFGLSAINSDNLNSSIGYGFYFRYDGRYSYIISGKSLGGWHEFGIGDKFKVERDTSEIRYYRNNVQVHTSTISPDISLLVDLAFGTQGSLLYDISISSEFKIPTSELYQHLLWTDVLGITDKSNPIEMTAETGWGNAGAASVNQLEASTDGWAEVTVLEMYKEKAFGISVANKDNHPESMSYGFDFQYNGTFQLVSHGQSLRGSVPFSIGDRLKISRESGEIKFYQNDVQVVTNNLHYNDSSFIVDIAFNENGALLYNIKVSDSFELPGCTFPPLCSNMALNGNWISYGSDSLGLYVNETGGVGIGTSAIPNDFKLAVDGKILAEEINVQISENWPDYVFEEWYSLTSLDELALYLKENKHLPGIPTAEEIGKSGINLGQMDAKILEKMEEVTLYLLDINQQLKAERAKVLKLQIEVNDLKSRLSTKPNGN